MISPFLIGKLAEEGKSLVFLSKTGRFKARIKGPVSGNILLRKGQYLTYQDPIKTLQIVKAIVAGKIKNSRILVNRSAREAKSEEDSQILKQTSENLKKLLLNLPGATDINQVRGIEGSAARVYFSTFTEMIKTNRSFFKFLKRTRRPPRDAINCLLSFVYTLLLNDCISAIETVGLDPQLGFLHEVRPGRPSLALDLMEEFRSIFADRLVIALINRKQIQPEDFEIRPGGSVKLKDKPRKNLLIAYQERKQDEMIHPFIDKKTSFGLIPHLQARILARHIREDIEGYVPFISR